VARLVLGPALPLVALTTLPNVSAPGALGAPSVTTPSERAVIRTVAQAYTTAERVGERFLPKPPGGGFPNVVSGTPQGPLIILDAPGSPAAAARATAYANDAVTYLRAEAVAGVTAAVQAGLEAGVNPREVARSIRAVVGLGEAQAAWVANLRAELVAGKLEQALDRKLINGTLRQTIAARLRNGKRLTPAEIDRIVMGYGDKWRAWHAESVARTMTLDLLRGGQIRAVRAAIARGDYDGLRVTKQWVTRLDGRERDSHRALDGTTQPINGFWYDDGVLRDVPGGWNCRCAFRVNLAFSD
jgi:hypothetical protein